MLSVKRCVAACLAVALLASGPALAANPVPVPVPPRAPARPHTEKPVVHASTFNSGTLLDAALGKVTLTDDVKTKVADALQACREKVAADRKTLQDRVKTLNDQIRKEADPAKKVELRKQLTESKPPTDAQQYENAKAAVKGIVPDDQFAKLDDLTRSIAEEMAVKKVTDEVAAWGKMGVDLTSDQKAKVDADVSALKDTVTKLEVGDKTGANSAGMKTLSDIRKNVLTDEQRNKISPIQGGGGHDADRPKEVPKEAPHGGSL